MSGHVSTRDLRRCGVAKCSQCHHPEEDHGPESGRWAGDVVIPGRLCYYEENQGHQEDLCPCSGFNTETPCLSYFETIMKKAGI